MDRSEFRQIGEEFLDQYWNQEYSKRQKSLIWDDINHFTVNAFRAAVKELKSDSPKFLPSPAMLIERVELLSANFRPENKKEIQEETHTEASQAAMKLACQWAQGKISKPEFDAGVEELKKQYPKAQFIHEEF